MPSSSRPIRWGIVSTGAMATRFAGELRLLPQDAELAAVVSRSADTARAFAETHRIPAAHDSVEAFATSGIDVAYIASPHSEHAAAAEALLRAGIPVLCEKPLTTSAAETARLISLADRLGVFLMEAVWTRCNPLFRLGLDLARRGEIGDIRLVRAGFGFVADESAPGHARLLRPELGGGAVLDVGCYPAHVIEAFLGATSRVFAWGEMLGQGIDATTSAVFDYPGGGGRPAAQGFAFASFQAEDERSVEVVGSAGRLVFDDVACPLVLRHHQTGAEVTRYTASPTGRGYCYEIAEVARCLRLGARQSDLCQWKATLAVAGMVDAWRAALADASVPKLREEQGCA
ncbi:MAG: Gfo/Idh/MocA family oxidoreductase [Propionibacteriaceae bacterium]|nr:Gfo/Idh/MocA family oxidoreductase [Propionibacteriaceae bacterium]